MKTFTVFCREASGRGTTWIGSVQARDYSSAMKKGARECANDWGWPVADVVAVGVAEGSVSIVFWDDGE